MMRPLLRALRMPFAKVQEANPNLGGLDDAPDLKNKELDKFRRFLNASNLYQAGK